MKKTIYINGHGFSVFSPSLDYVLKIAEEMKRDSLRAKLINVPTNYRIQLLDNLGSYFRDDTQFRREAAEMLSEISAKSTQLATYELEQAGHILSRAYLEEMVDRELGTKNHRGSEYLDGWVKDGNIYNRKVPLGVLFHNLASNSVMVPVASYIFGALTKNGNIMKVSGGEPYLAFKMQDLLENIEGSGGDVLGSFKVFYWPGEDTITLYEPLLSKIDGIVHWGGAESTRKIGQLAAEYNVKLISHGPKISFEVVEHATGESLLGISMGIAIDSSIGDQKDCHSSRLVWHKSRDEVDSNMLAKSVLKSMVEFNKKYPRRSCDNHSKIQYYESEGSEVYKSGGMTVVVLNRSPKPIDIDMSINRFVVVSPYKDRSEIRKFIEKSNLQGHLQTLGFDGGYEGLDQDFRTEMAIMGFSNITEIGQMGIHSPGTSHDRILNLRELTEICSCQEYTRIYKI